jgi:hypothetical protein
VPLYAGDPDLGAEWNMKGVILLDRKGWREQVNALRPCDWETRLPAMRDNYERARAYLTHSRSLVLWLVRHGILADRTEQEVLSECTPDAELPCNQPAPEEPPKPLEPPPITVAAPKVETIPAVPSFPPVQEASRTYDPAGLPLRCEVQTIYCWFNYFVDSDFKAEHQLLERWYASWEKAGWAPRVVGWADLHWDDWQAAAFRAFRKLPSMNSPAYSVGNFMRWLFMSQTGGYLADHDVINYGWGPREVPEDGLALCRGEYVPGLLAAPAVEWRKAALYMMKHAHDLSPIHVGEVQAFQKYRPFRQVPVAALYNDPDWKLAPVVHYANQVTPHSAAMPRAQFIDKERPL